MIVAALRARRRWGGNGIEEGGVPIVANLKRGRIRVPVSLDRTAVPGLLPGLLSVPG